jgi:hypothetical protein
LFRAVLRTRHSARQIVALAAPVQQADSGGPFVTADELVADVVFAGDPADGATGYPLSANQVRPGVDRAIIAGHQAGLGACRF